jgi:hypothetical protein
MTDKFRFVVRPDFAWGEYRIMFGHEMANGKLAIAQPVVMKVRDEAELGLFSETPVMLSVERPALQSLMDELWKEGIRPQDIGTPGHLAATQEHLKDMKKLVSKAYDVTL